MKRILYFFAVVMMVAGCGQSYEEKRKVSHKRRMQQLREDSAALKVAVVPTLDCLPLFLAKERKLFDSLGVDVRLKLFTAQMDCDTAVLGGSVEGVVTDLVRAERMQKHGTPLRYVSSTNAYWQLYSNRMARIRELKQLDDKMIAMTRYSATDLLAGVAVDSGKLKSERLYKIQVNDVDIRLRMLLGYELDAALLTEPQATGARLAHHHLLLDSRKLSLQMGVIAFREKSLKDKERQKQLDVFCLGYNMACDSLTRHGIGKYRDLVVKYCKVKESLADSLPAGIKFHHIAEPLEADVERAKKWLVNNEGK